jgi:phosphatidate cytidylyltransferase
MSNLVKRALSALILAPLVIFITYKGGLVFFAMIFILFLAMFYEWVNITKKAQQKLLWWIFGFFYIGFACMVMLFLERLRVDFETIKSVPVHLFVLVALVWINDIFSYLFGKSLGGPKLAPKISPNKTWAGTIGGITACVALFFILNYTISFGANQISDEVFYTVLGLHILVPVVALLGDLFESFVKRKFGVKDSGNIIPGHGGILDRMDGLILVMNVTGLMFYVMFAMRAGQIAASGASI